MSKKVAINQRGATLVELALVLPFFLYLILAAIDFTRIVVGYSSVRAAASIGARRAAALSRPPWPDFISVGLPATVVPSALNPYHSFKSPDGDGSWYQNKATSLGISRLFAPEVRAIGYGELVIGRSLGWTKYPCDGAGCVKCFPVRGSAAKFINPLGGVVYSGYASKQISLECEFDVPMLLSGFTGGLISPFLKLTARAYSPVESSLGRFYAP